MHTFIHPKLLLHSDLMKNPFIDAGFKLLKYFLLISAIFGPPCTVVYFTAFAIIILCCVFKRMCFENKSCLRHVFIAS